MAILTGKLEDGRIRIKVGIRPFQDYGPVDGVSSAQILNYRECNALVDTGARRTCVTENTVQSLGLRRKGRAEVWNIKRPEMHFTYLFHVAIWPDTQQSYHAPVAPYGIGSEIEGIDVGDNRFFDILLGMDIISQGSFHLERSGEFRFEF